MYSNQSKLIKCSKDFGGEKMFGNQDLLVSYMLGKAKIVFSAQTRQKAKWQLSDTDQNNLTSIGAGY